MTATMSKMTLLVLLFFFVSQGVLFGATYYADTYGTGTNCSIESPCNIEYAVEKKACFGDIVKINDGTYSIQQLVVPAGVSLTSTSEDNTKVKLQPNKDLNIYTPFISLVSVEPGSFGNQTISYLEFDGISNSNNAKIGIQVQNRSDVRIHHCNIHDFTGEGGYGVYVLSTQIERTSKWWEYWPADAQAPGTDTNLDAVWPKNPVQNFQLDNNTITNCGYRNTLGSGSITGAVCPYNLKNSSIHHNKIDTTNSYGECILATSAFLWNVDIYNNVLTMSRYTDRSSYIIELWNFRNGCEIYNNTANENFSAGTGKETSVYKNTIISNPPRTNIGVLGIEFTLQTEGSVYENFLSGGYGSQINVGITNIQGQKPYIVRNVVIRNNVIYNGYGHHATVQCYGSNNGAYSAQVNGIDILKNVFNKNRNAAYNLVYLHQQNGSRGTCNLTDVEIKSNVMMNSLAYAGKTTGTVNGLSISKNIFYGNALNDWSGSTDQETSTMNPLFVGPEEEYNGYALKAGSPAIDIGFDIGGISSSIAADVTKNESTLFIGPPGKIKNLKILQ